MILQKHVDRKLARDSRYTPTRKMAFDKQTRGSPSRLANTFVEGYRPRMMELRSISQQFKRPTGRLRYGIISSEQRTRIGVNEWDIKYNDE